MLYVVSLYQQAKTIVYPERVGGVAELGGNPVAVHGQYQRDSGVQSDRTRVRLRIRAWTNSHGEVTLIF